MTSWVTCKFETEKSSRENKVHFVKLSKKKSRLREGSYIEGVNIATLRCFEPETSTKGVLVCRYRSGFVERSLVKHAFHTYLINLMDEGVVKHR